MSLKFQSISIHFSTIQSKDLEIQKLAHDASTATSLNQEIGAQLSQCKAKFVDLQDSVKTLIDELDATKNQLEVEIQAGAKSKAEVEALSKALAEESAKVKALEELVIAKDSVINESKIMISKLKTLGRTFKDKFEKKEEEVAEQTALIKTLEELVIEKDSVINESKILISECQEKLEKKGEEEGIKNSASLATIEEGSGEEDELAEAGLLVSRKLVLDYFYNYRVVTGRLFSNKALIIQCFLNLLRFKKHLVIEWLFLLGEG